MNATNLLAYAAQVTLIVLACAGLPRLLGLRSPGVQYAFWRTLLVLCVLLPMVQPWQPGEMVVVPAPGPAPAGVSVGPTALAPAAPPLAPRFDWVAAARLVIVAGIAARLAWIGLGMIRLRRLRQRAVDAATGFEDLQNAIGATASLLWSPEVRHPVTFGVLRPVVLLPIALKAADPAAQRAVVAHELHHVRRRDWGWVVAEELVRSAFWFHPAMWWLVSRVQLARETVVDELSILATNARRTYLDTLLAFADDRGLASPPAFSARRHLFHRIMLLSKEAEMSSIRVAIASCVLVIALGGGAWMAVSAFPLHGSASLLQESTARTPPGAPQSPVYYHRIAQELWQRANEDPTLTPGRKMQAILKAIAAEDLALAADPAFGPAIVYKSLLLRLQSGLTPDAELRTTLTVQADELQNRYRRLVEMEIEQHARKDGVPPPPPSQEVERRFQTPTPPPPPRSRLSLPPPPPPAPPAPAGAAMAGMLTANAASVMSQEYQLRVQQLDPVRIGGNIKTPTKTRDVKPVYPPLAQTANVQGVVIIEALIDIDGKVVDARILRSIPLLNEAALTAVMQWAFAPTLFNGVPRAVMMTVTVNFTQQ
jgi:TonB family protein